MVLLLIIALGFIHRLVEALTWRFSDTRFANRDPLFWNPSISKLKAKRLFGEPLDVESLLTAFYLILVIIAIVVHFGGWYALPVKSELALFGIYMLVYVIAYNLAGSLYIFRKPKSKQVL